MNIPYFNGMHRFMPALFIAQNCDNYFIEVNHRSRKYGISKYGIIDRLIKGVIDLIRVQIIIKNIKSNL